MGTPTFMNVSPYGSSGAGGGSSGPVNVSIDTVELASALKEGFKRDLGEWTQELTDAIEAHGALICKDIDDHATSLNENLKGMEEHLEFLSRHGTVSIDECANMMREIVSVLATINQQIGNSASLLQKSVKDLNLKAEIPISSVTVGIPRSFIAALMLPPFLTGIVLWALLKFSS